MMQLRYRYEIDPESEASTMPPLVGYKDLLDLADQSCPTPCLDRLQPLIALPRTRIDTSLSRVKTHIYAHPEWRDYYVSQDPTRFDLARYFRENPPCEKGQAAINALWLETWERDAKYWPQEQADAYCSFAITHFSQKSLEVVNNYFWFRTPHVQDPWWFFFVHGWLIAKRMGKDALRRKDWFGWWSQMYSIDALDDDLDPRWKAAIKGFNEPWEPDDEHDAPPQKRLRRKGLGSTITDTTASPIIANTQPATSTPASYSDAALRNMYEDGFQLFKSLEILAKESPELAPDVYQRKKSRLQAQIDMDEAKIKKLQADIQSHRDKVRALDQAQDGQAVRTMAQSFMDMVTARRLEQEVDDVEFERLKVFVEKKMRDGVDTAGSGS